MRRSHGSQRGWDLGTRAEQRLQGAGGHRAVARLQRRSRRRGLHGAAKELNPGGVALAEANLSGALSGSSFEFTVAWPNGSTGQYTGNFDAGGHLSGVTFDVAHPTSQATWFRQEPQF
jgi:hypothetical protein